MYIMKNDDTSFRVIVQGRRNIEDMDRTCKQES